MTDDRDTAARAPKPTNYTDTTEFWTAANAGVLKVQHDSTTGQPQWFPRSLSMSTGRRQLDWRAVSGNGVLYSWTVTYSAWPGHEDRVPYVCALVDLAEGVRILANVVNVDPEELAVGQQLQVAWDDLGDGGVYPVFEPR